uniref:Uncharacterized protein n=1 Tax=Rhodnius prolixus TaxID=13249 RepID=T1HQG8_RHOPR
MESELDVGKISLSKLLAEFSAMIDAKGLARKEDLDELKIQFSALQDENRFLRASVENLQKRNDTLEYRLEVMENEGRKNNLLFKGLNNRDVEDSEFISTFCKDVLKVPVSLHDIANVYKINIGNSGKHLLKVTFTRANTVREVLKNTKKLKGSGFFIDRDYSFAVRARRKHLLQFRKELLQKDKTKRIVLRRDILYVEGKKYIWCELDNKVKEMANVSADRMDSSSERQAVVRSGSSSLPAAS